MTRRRDARADRADRAAGAARHLATHHRNAADQGLLGGKSFGVLRLLDSLHPTTPQTLQFQCDSAAVVLFAPMCDKKHLTLQSMLHRGRLQVDVALWLQQMK